MNLHIVQHQEPGNVFLTSLEVRYWSGHEVQLPSGQTVLRGAEPDWWFTFPVEGESDLDTITSFAFCARRVKLILESTEYPPLVNLDALEPFHRALLKSFLD